MTASLKSRFRYHTRPGKWKFVLAGELVCHLGIPLRGSHVFIDKGITIARLDGALLTIFEGYAIDGCSPAIDIRGRRVGTPSPESTLPAAFVHDCLYQFASLACAGWSRSQADSIFRDLLRARGFPLADVYFLGVTIFGGIHRALRRPSTSIACITHHC